MGSPADVPPGFIPLYDPDGTMINKMFPFTQVPMQPTINKYYNISLSDPLGNHSYINRIYEDVLPSDKTVYTFLTTRERYVIKKFMRNSILDKYDGEEFTIQGSKKSLLSWIKIYDVNPYSLKSNPYEDIPCGFLLYRSAYPIRYNKDDRTIKATPTSIAVNIRIYKMSIAASRCREIIKDSIDEYFDVWRDIKYYQWVNTIIEKNISPNFINMLLYVFDTESKIGFDKLNSIKQSKDKLAIVNKNKNEVNIINGTTVLHMGIVASKGSPILKLLPLFQSSLKKPDTNIDLSKEELLKDDTRVLVALTEAPNTNIIKWNTKVYQSYGSVQKMTSTGYHNPDVWYSILFQLVYACAVLQENGIYFNNFSLENNVFIKDVQSDNTGKSCWVYIINNIEYYVPNYGYLLVIDSNFADINNIDTTTPTYKIYGSIFKENSEKKDLDLKDKFINLMDTNCFKNENGNELDDNIKTLIDSIKMFTNTNTKIIDVIPEFFKKYLHNKVGTLLTKFEKENFSIFNKPTYVEGSLMIRQKRYDEYEWVIYKNQHDTNKNKRIIISKDRIKDEFIIEEVFSSTLYSYFQKVSPNEINIIETYSYN